MLQISLPADGTAHRRALASTHQGHQGSAEKKINSGPEDLSLLTEPCRRLGSLVKTSLGLRAGRRELGVQIMRPHVQPVEGDETRSLDYSLEKNRKTWWISPKDSSLFHFAMQKMDVVVLSETGTMAHF